MLPTPRRGLRVMAHALAVRRSTKLRLLKDGLFKEKDPRKIARSLKDSVEHSERRHADPYRSAMSMLTFYINRAGAQLQPSQRVERHLAALRACRSSSSSGAACRRKRPAASWTGGRGMRCREVPQRRWQLRDPRSPLEHRQPQGRLAGQGQPEHRQGWQHGELDGLPPPHGVPSRGVEPELIVRLHQSLQVVTKGSDCGNQRSIG